MTCVVGVREVNALFPFRGDVHPGNNGVDLMGFQRNQEGVEVHVLDHELNTEVLGKLLGNVHFKTNVFGFAVLLGSKFVWRVVSTGPDDQGSLLLDPLYRVISSR